TMSDSKGTQCPPISEPPTNTLRLRDLVKSLEVAASRQDLPSHLRRLFTMVAQEAGVQEAIAEFNLAPIPDPRQPPSLMTGTERNQNSTRSKLLPAEQDGMITMHPSP